jgi:uncharacterized phage protein (TIGR02216 family)
MITEPFPWARIMQLGLGTLRLAPEQFWRATLREIAAALPKREAALDRAILDRLMSEHPDP